jgi:hypothetical protein
MIFKTISDKLGKKSMGFIKIRILMGLKKGILKYQNNMDT